MTPVGWHWPACDKALALRLGRPVCNALIAGLWLWLYRPVLAYLAVIFSREQFRSNQVLLLLVVALAVLQWRRGVWRFSLAAAPALHLPALALATGGSLLYLAAERLADVNTLSALLFGLATYGLLGLWLDAPRWRAGLPAALLLVGTLPIGEHLQTFAGYPLRILTASIVRDGLAALGVHSVGVDTILVFENGISQVDLPCSGVRSLWTGALFLLSATWLTRRPLNLRWLASAAVMAVALCVGNIARVGLLVTAGQVLGLRLLAEMLHVPLGVLAFTGACAAALAVLGWRPAGEALTPPATGMLVDRSARPASPEGMSGAGVRTVLPSAGAGVGAALLAPALAGAILLMALLYSPRGQATSPEPARAWDWPAGLDAQPLPLAPAELTWLQQDGAASVERLRFTWRGLGGSAIFITSRSWRAQHQPERCFAVYGLSIDDSRTYLAAAGFPLRAVTLGQSRGDHPLSAAYWFQSAGRTTDDYGARIWADLAPRPGPWVLVSVLFDDFYPPQDVDVQALYAALHAAVARRLQGGPP